MRITFEKISDFERGTLRRLLADAYSFDARCAQCWDADWRAFDRFFYDHLDIADRCGFVTALQGQPIGFISWDPRHRPEYVEIGHNCIAAAFKGNGYGKSQLQEAVARIGAYPGLEKIIVRTNANLVAPRNYESVGFRLRQRRPNDGPAAFAGDELDYELTL